MTLQPIYRLREPKKIAMGDDFATVVTARQHWGLVGATNPIIKSAQLHEYGKIIERATRERGLRYGMPLLEAPMGAASAVDGAMHRFLGVYSLQTSLAVVNTTESSLYQVASAGYSMIIPDQVAIRKSTLDKAAVCYGERYQLAERCNLAAGGLNHAAEHAEPRPFAPDASHSDSTGPRSSGETKRPEWLAADRLFVGVSCRSGTPTAPAATGVAYLAGEPGAQTVRSRFYLGAPTRALERALTDIQEEVACADGQPLAAIVVYSESDASDKGLMMSAAHDHALRSVLDGGAALTHVRVAPSPAYVSADVAVAPEGVVFALDDGADDRLHFRTQSGGQAYEYDIVSADELLDARDVANTAYYLARVGQLNCGAACSRPWLLLAADAAADKALQAWPHVAELKQHVYGCGQL